MRKLFFVSFLLPVFILAKKEQGVRIDEAIKTSDRVSLADLPEPMIKEFITPLYQDSFYLRNDAKTIHYCIVYKKGESNALFKDPVTYLQYFGFASSEKFSQATIYTLDYTDNAAKIGTSGKTGLVQKGTMIGGKNYLAKLPQPGKTIKWPMNIFGEKYNLSAQIVDNVYRGKTGKCLVVSRVNIMDGKEHTESWYYQQGAGLVKIASDNDWVFTR
ncbi:MAG TPA: hypothetical protein PLU37_09655 [Chitinophagaceae bacterium]|nr:hypothetical protein [Chitinophagaceae bacterium]MCB9056037.1 hypothetical protein [Chitinophagales bacterium]HPG11784.1 hypothetical protein [Chitinophagaceae bacterium]HRX94158.1 hypothetical protein [Chitinophagaceae bacterium]